MTETGGPMVEEAVVRLIVAGVDLFEWRCTPEQLPALVVGRLYAEELIENGEIAGSLVVEHEAGAIVISAPVLSQAGQRPRTRAGGELPGAPEFAELFRDMFAGVEARHESGGMHAAALAAGGRIAFQAEDVGRHNAVDKVIGMALLHGAEPRVHGMLISARVSGEIARKAAGSGVAWLASRSIPTTLAVAVAGRAGLPIIGRAAGKHAHVYV